MELSGHFFGEGVLYLILGAVIAGGAQLFIIKIHAGQHNLFWAHVGQAAHKLFNIIPGVWTVLIRLLKKKACLGDVWQQQVCLFAELAHFIHHMVVKNTVKLTLISHNRVHIDQCVV